MWDSRCVQGKNSLAQCSYPRRGGRNGLTSSTNVLLSVPGSTQHAQSLHRILNCFNYLLPVYPHFWRAETHFSPVYPRAQGTLLEQQQEGNGDRMQFIGLVWFIKGSSCGRTQKVAGLQSIRCANELRVKPEDISNLSPCLPGLGGSGGFVHNTRSFPSFCADLPAPLQQWVEAPAPVTVIDILRWGKERTGTEVLTSVGLPHSEAPP
jgi:hypothetical protein